MTMWPPTQVQVNQWLYQDDQKNVASYYDQWISSQDFNYEHIIPYNPNPRVLAKHMKPYLEKQENLKMILDVGAGSGFLVKELRPIVGPGVIFDALEPSDLMRQKAKDQDLYRSYYSDFVNGLNSTNIASETYDCVCSTACFVPGHIPAVGTMEMMRLAKIGGFIATNIRASYVYEHEAFKGKFLETLEKMEEDGVAEKLEVTHGVPHFGDHEGIVVVYRKVGRI